MRSFCRPVVSSGRADQTTRDARRAQSMQGSRFACVMIASCVALGCTQVVGDYSVEKAGNADLPVLPAFLPEGDLKIACEACVKANCGGWYDKCVESERCRRMLRCTSTCDDPSCITRCTADNWDSPYFRDYFACAFTAAAESATEVATQCASKCGVGSHWDCIGEFTWDLPSGTTGTTVQLYDKSLPRSGGPLRWPAPDAEIAACNDGVPGPPVTGETGCDDDWKPLGAYGHAPLTFAYSNAIGLRGGAHPRQQQRIYPRPEPPSGPLLLLGIYPSGIWGASLPDTPLDRSLGTILASQFDCLTTVAAADIRLTGPGAPEPHYLKYPGQINPNDQYGSLALFVNVRPAQAVEITSSLSDGTQVSRRSVLVASDWQANVFLYPMSTKEAGL